MSRALLYRSENNTSLLLDLPATIEDAQERCDVQVMSIAPLQIPYLTPEPKGAKRDILLAQLPSSEQDFHSALCEEIVTALNTIHGCFKESWCLPRWHGDSKGSDRLKEHEAPFSAADLVPPVVLSPLENCFTSFASLKNTIVRNTDQQAAIVHVLDLSVSFHIPPGSTFIYSSVEDGCHVLENALNGPLLMFKEQGELEFKFDLILLDPPWANRSVRNSRSYWTAEDQGRDPFDEVVPVLKHYSKAEGYVAIWITNKTSLRDRVVSMLQNFGFMVHEEWIWVKVTANGEPVTQLDGLWRKPYEILLLFRRKVRRGSPNRRFVFAVPDVHSRKPNLKLLFEEVLPPKCLALEIFARNLTAGWWCWGDEVLKYQVTSQWRARNQE